MTAIRRDGTSSIKRGITTRVRPPAALRDDGEDGHAETRRAAPSACISCPDTPARGADAAAEIPRRSGPLVPHSPFRKARANVKGSKSSAIRRIVGLGKPAPLSPPESARSGVEALESAPGSAPQDGHAGPLELADAREPLPQRRSRAVPAQLLTDGLAAPSIGRCPGRGRRTRGHLGRPVAPRDSRALRGGVSPNREREDGADRQASVCDAIAQSTSAQMAPCRESRRQGPHSQTRSPAGWRPL